MKAWLGCFAGALLALGAAPTNALAQIDCVEECKRLNPGFGCVPGSQGENCTAGVNYCMIDVCDDPEGFGGIRGVDGMRYYVVIPCQRPAVIVPARVVTLVEEIADQREVADPEREHRPALTSS